MSSRPIETSLVSPCSTFRVGSLPNDELPPEMPPTSGYVVTSSAIRGQYRFMNDISPNVPSAETHHYTGSLLRHNNVINNQFPVWRNSQMLTGIEQKSHNNARNKATNNNNNFIENHGSVEFYDVSRCHKPPSVAMTSCTGNSGTSDVVSPQFLLATQTEKQHTPLKKRASCFCYVVATTIMLLLLGCVVVATVIITTKSQGQTNQVKTVVDIYHGKNCSKNVTNFTECEDAECYVTMTNIFTKMNTKVDPCDGLFKHKTKAVFKIFKVVNLFVISKVKQSSFKRTCK